MSILVVGRRGQVARALARRAVVRGLAATTIGRPELDLERDGVEEAIVAQRPRVVINVAAYTAVDKAEDEPARAWRINAAAAAAVARGASEIGAPIIHVSTDYVFAGDLTSAYRESDPTGPLGVYGASKLEGERLVSEANPRTVILRTAWVFDATGSNFVRTMLRLAKSREEIGVVADQRGCPTFADDLADAVLTVAESPTTFGVYHVAGGGETTWAAFAEAIFAESEVRRGPTARVRPIAAADFPTRARRPANSRLDCTKLKTDYGASLPPWREALPRCMDEISASGWRVE